MLGKLKAAVKRLFFWRYRSSVTGEYVTREYAERNPDTTQRERID